MTFDAHYAAGLLAGWASAVVLRASFRQMAIAVWEWKTERLRARVAPGNLVWFRISSFGWCYGVVKELSDDFHEGYELDKTLLLFWYRQGKTVYRYKEAIFAEPPPFVLGRDVPRPKVMKDGSYA